MSLAYSIKTVKDLAHAFAAADEFMSALSSILHPEPDSFTMTPNEDWYVAPYCFMRTTAPRSKGEGFLVFSSMVPFVKTSEHLAAKVLVKRNGFHNHNVPFVDTIENFQDRLDLIESDIYTFTSDGCVPTAQDVSQELEDTAIRVVCDLMKWRYPHNWRKKRAEVSYFFTGWPVMDLAKYDSRRGKKEQLQHHHHHQLRHQVMQQQRQQQRYYQEQQEQWYDATQYAKVPAENTNEEKKDSPTLDYLPLPPVHTPIQQKDTGGGFFERNADIFGSNQTFIPNRYNHNNSKYFEDDDGNTFISNNDAYDDYDNDFLYDADVGI